MVIFAPCRSGHSKRRSSKATARLPPLRVARGETWILYYPPVMTRMRAEIESSESMRKPTEEDKP